jgi:hypothetical protein
MAMTDKVPQVTRDDVVRVVRRDFRPKDRKAVLKMLDEYGAQSGHGACDRVHLAILKLSAGDIDQVREHIETAKSDFRDVVAPAEYPEFWKIGFVGVESLCPKLVQ